MECVLEREITGDTARQVYEIAQDYTADYFTPGYPDDMRVDMLFQQAMLLKDGPRVVAFILFTALEGSPHITTMATRRTHSGQGHGKRLMRHFVEHIQSLGLNSIELFTFSPASRPGYHTTVAFYQGAGFSIQREYPDLWIPGTTTLKMRKSW